MKLLEATQRSARGRNENGPEFRVWLACGFTPLSLQTYVEAHLAAALPSRKIVAQTGEYASLLETLASAAADSSAGTLCCIEWADLDPRLSARSTAPHTMATLDEIVASASETAKSLQNALIKLRGQSLVVSLPTLELPPLFPSPTQIVSRWEARLHLVRASLADALAGEGVRVLSDVRLRQKSADAMRWSLRSELEFDFPFTLRHADALAHEMVSALLAPTRRKGLVLDLDNTMWSGIIGDEGASGVTWDLASHSQHHAFFQRLVNLLAETGVFVGVASKNDSALAEEGLARADLLIKRESIFPVQANWSAKSDSISAIARVWNVGEDSLVFVDDSELEREEVTRAHASLETLSFPAGDANLLPGVMNKLRDLFGTMTVSEEDRLRAASVRNSIELVAQVDSSGELSEEILAGLRARIRIVERAPGTAERALQLLNKTNQFNANGRRWDAQEFGAAVEQGYRVISVEYDDRYGRLGEISSLLVREMDGALLVHAWVLSCRAFARRIEHMTLQRIVAHFGSRELHVAVADTGRNSQSLRMFAQIADDGWTPPPSGEVRWLVVSAESLLRRLPSPHGEVVGEFSDNA